MKKIIMISLVLCSMGHTAFSQRVVFDSRHFTAVSENGAVRLAAELSHEDMLEKIKTSLYHANLNSGTVVMAQRLIYSALTNVNAALKNGIMLKDMGLICADILNYSTQMVNLARSEPYLLLFAEQMFRDMNARGVNIIAEVGRFVLHDGGDLLMDHNKRDELIKKLSVELHILDGLTYGAWKAMYYAKKRGIFQFLNPFSSFVSSDRNYVDEILRNAKYLTK